MLKFAYKLKESSEGAARFVSTLFLLQGLCTGSYGGSAVRLLFYPHSLHNEPLALPRQRLLWSQHLRYALKLTTLDELSTDWNCILSCQSNPMFEKKWRQRSALVIHGLFCVFAAMDYVYAQNCGIFLTSTVYFVIYCAVRSNKPRVYSRAILPGKLRYLDSVFI